MAWTSPRTWVAAETVTAALLNTHLRDNLKAIGDAWTSYTPAWTASSSNPVINNGTLAGAWLSAGKKVEFWAQITAGSTTTFGTGNYRLTLPTAPSNHLWLFMVEYRDTGTNRWTGSAVWNNSGGYMELYAPATTAGNADRNVTPTVPFTFANTDVIFVHGTYEAA